MPYGRKSILQILNVQDEDFGEYNCSVTNSRGNVSLLITLTEKGVLEYQICNCCAFFYSLYTLDHSILYIRKTCPCSIYPLKPHFYVVKLGFAGV